MGVYRNEKILESFGVEAGHQQLGPFRLSCTPTYREGEGLEIVNHQWAMTDQSCQRNKTSLTPLNDGVRGASELAHMSMAGTVRFHRTEAPARVTLWTLPSTPLQLTVHV